MYTTHVITTRGIVLIPNNHCMRYHHHLTKAPPVYRLQSIPSFLVLPKKFVLTFEFVL